MIFFGDALKPLHDVCRAMKAALDKDTLPTKAALAEWLEKSSETAEAMNKRMYIYTTAQAKGWAFAKKLEFYEAGILLCLSLSRSFYGIHSDFFARRE